MKIIKRWIKNIKWLFNHPPIGITDTGERLICDYCGKLSYDYISFSNHYMIKTICWECILKVFDKSLKIKK
jgi:hypothetical protein